MKAKRGEVYYADLNPVRGSEQSGWRPVVVVQRNTLNAFTSTAIIVPCTGSQVEKYRQLPTGVFIPKGVGGLKADSVALVHQIRTLSHERLEDYWGTLPEDTMREIERAMAYALNITI